MSLVLNGTTGLVTNSGTVVSTTDATLNGLTVGKGAGSVSTNTAVGASALAANSTGGRATTVGYLAGTTSNASQVTYIGSYAGQNATGSFNTAIGDAAFTGNGSSNGQYNTAIGGGALNGDTTGGNNTSIGFQSLYFNTTASNNTAVGYQALYSNTVANNSVAIGHQAGYSYVGTTGGNNVLVGQAAGYALTTGNGNTFIGSSITTAGSGAAVTTGTKNTIIGGYSGNQGGVDIRTASNYIVLSDGDGNPRAFVNSSGNLILSNSSSFYNTAEASFQVNQSANSEYTGHFISSASSAPYGLFTRFTGADPNNTTSFVFGAYANTASTYIYRIYSNGTVAARSDSRFKKNIETARDGYADDLSKLRIVKYNWYNNEDGTPKELGWIAQEVEEVFPGLVQTDVADDGTECKSVKLSVFTPMLIKAVQELNAQVKELKAEFDAYKEAHQ